MLRVTLKDRRPIYIMHPSLSGLLCRSVTCFIALTTILHLPADYAILHGPSDTTAIVNKSTYFNCSTSKLPANHQSIFWYHFPLDGDGPRKYIFQYGRITTTYKNRFDIDIDLSSGTFNLLALKVDSKDAGRFECSEDIQGDLGASAELVVLSSNLICESDMNPGGVVGTTQCDTAIAPDEVRLSCNVMYNGKNAPEMVWRNAGDSSTSMKTDCVNTYHRVTCNATLTANFQPDRSVYHCETTMQKYTCSLEITNVLYAFANRPTTKRNYSTGNEVICLANTSRELPCSYKWFDNNTAETSSQPMFTPEDPGLYKCQAQCAIRTNTCTFTAMVISVPDQGPNLLYFLCLLLLIPVIILAIECIPKCVRDDEHSPTSLQLTVPKERALSKSPVPERSEQVILPITSEQEPLLNSSHSRDETSPTAKSKHGAKKYDNIIERADVETKVQESNEDRDVEEPNPEENVEESIEETDVGERNSETKVGESNEETKVGESNEETKVGESNEEAVFEEFNLKAEVEEINAEAVNETENLIIERHRKFLEERMDPYYGLLDTLLANEALSWREYSEVVGKGPILKRNSLLLNYIIERHQYSGLVAALRNNEQQHIVNYLSANSEYNSDYWEDWPLTERETSILDTNRQALIELMDLSVLLGILCSSKVINRRQMNFISSRPNSDRKTETLLDILRRRSLRDYQKTIRCLHLSNQSPIADVFESGGVVSAVHAHFEGPFDKVTHTEDEIVTAIERFLKKSSSLIAESRILEILQMRIIACKKGQSIVLYIWCDKSEVLSRLVDSLTNGRFKESAQRLFKQLLPHSRRVEIKDITMNAEDYLRLEAYFTADTEDSGSPTIQVMPYTSKRFSLTDSLKRKFVKQLSSPVLFGGESGVISAQPNE